MPHLAVPHSCICFSGGHGQIMPERAAEEGTSARPGRRVQLTTLEQAAKAIQDYEASYADDLKASAPCQSLAPSF